MGKKISTMTDEQMVGLEAAGLALAESEPSPKAGRVWTSPTSSKVAHRVNSITPVRNPTVLKRLLRRLAG